MKNIIIAAALTASTAFCEHQHKGTATNFGGNSFDTGTSDGRGKIVLNVSPPSASVLVDGKYMGTAAELNGTSMDMTAGMHEVRLVNLSWREEVSIFHSTDGRDRIVELALNHKAVKFNDGRYGVVRLMSDDPKAQVYSDGYFCGRVEEFTGDTRLLLAPGTRQLTIESKGGAVASQSIQVRDNRRITVDTRNGQVKVNPATARVSGSAAVVAGE